MLEVANTYQTLKVSLIHALPVEERRVLSRSEAASYAGVSLGLFEKLVRAGALPSPLPFGRVKRWDRVGLDRALDKLSGLATSSTDASASGYDAWKQLHG